MTRERASNRPDAHTPEVSERGPSGPAAKPQRAGTREGRHEPGSSLWWEESWDIEFLAPGAAPDDAFGGFVRIAHLPNQRRMWCWVYVLRADGTVVVRDHDIPLSSTTSTSSTLLARAEGLWCELVCETPMEHWSIGVEAFGVRLDDPWDGFRGEIGTRLAVGLDLEWETQSPSAVDAEGPSSYQHLGAVHGDVLLGDEVIALDGVGVRRHAWGDRDWWTRPETSLWCTTDAGHGIDVDERLVAPLLDAVIPLPPRNGRAPSLTRSLVRARAGEATPAGHGWLERLQIDS